MTKVYLEPDEVGEIIKAAPTIRDELMIRLLFWLGCRISELLAITVSDIDFSRQLVTIKHLKQRVSLSCPNCGSRLSRVAKFCPGCGQGITEPIRKQQERHRQRQLSIDQATLTQLKTFIKECNLKGRIFNIGRNQAWLIIRDAAIRAGIPKLLNPDTGKLKNVSPHRLRDSFAVMAVLHDDSTDGIRMLQERLGHSSISTTMRYRKVTGDQQREWFEKLAESNGNEG